MIVLARKGENSAAYSPVLARACYPVDLLLMVYLPSSVFRIEKIGRCPDFYFSSKQRREIIYLYMILMLIYGISIEFHLCIYIPHGLYDFSCVRKGNRNVTECYNDTNRHLEQQ